MTRNDDRNSTYGRKANETTDRLGEIILGEDGDAGVIYHDKDRPRDVWIQSDTVVEVEQ